MYFVLLSQVRRYYLVRGLLAQVIGELKLRSLPLKTETNAHLTQHVSLMLSEFAKDMRIAETIDAVYFGDRRPLVRLRCSVVR